MPITSSSTSDSVLKTRVFFFSRSPCILVSLTFSSKYFLTNVCVEDALSKQPEGLELYKQMKQVYSETSPFFKTAKADVENKMASIVKDIQDKNITQEVGLDKLISLKEKGLAKFDEIQLLKHIISFAP